MAEPSASPPARELWESELLVVERIGRLIEFWGFKRTMGRVWAVLYLSPVPLSAAELKEALQVSSGAVSMTLAELLRWGVVRKVWVPGDRRDFYEAEVQLWKMISRVMSEREGGEIAAAIETCERALAALEERERSRDPEVRSRVEVQRARITALLGLARLGKQLLDALLSTAKVDAEPLARVELSR